MDNIEILTQDNFIHEVLESPGIVLVDFWGAGCRACATVKPVIAGVADRIKVGTLNVTDYPEVASVYEINALPTIMLFKGGNILETFTGVVSQKKLDSLLEEYGAA